MVSQVQAASPILLIDVVSIEKTNNTAEKCANAVKAVFWTLAMIFNPIIDFFTQGLSDFLALETLRHGTNYSNYIKIRLHGADPKYGGGTTGAGAAAGTGPDNHFLEKSKNYFFVSQDSAAYTDRIYQSTPCVEKILSSIWVRCFSSRFYCAASTAASTREQPLFIRIAAIVLSILFVPTINFRFRPEELSANFENDPQCACNKDPTKGIAYQTKNKLETDRIGLQGILVHGLKGNVFERMKADPLKVLWGLVKLINPIGIAILIPLGFYLAGKALYESCTERSFQAPLPIKLSH